MTRVHFSDHAAWRAAERHGETVRVEELEEKIASALDGGWAERLHYGNGDLVVTTEDGRRYVLRPCDNGWVVVTALG